MKGAVRWIGWLVLMALLAHPLCHAVDDHAHQSGQLATHQCALCSPLAFSPVTASLAPVSWVSFFYASQGEESPRGVVLPIERGRAPPARLA